MGTSSEEAVAQYREGHYDEALRTSASAISENPENAWPHKTASRVLTELGRHQEAQAMARDAVALAPHEADNHWILALALVPSDPDLDETDHDEADLVEARAAADRAVSRLRILSAATMPWAS